ncbi:MAG: 1-acyl-sn-glycerol-3-phosphate acyltransferase [Cyanobacteria bacterium P01_G01_bin.19]
MGEAKFLPPKQNAVLTRLIQSIFYIVMYFAYQIKLEVSDRDIATLKKLDGKRVIYLPNHSNLDDGLVMFLFSARLGQLFHYIVAYEAFNGIIGWLMQSVGAYSIRRGVGDRSSILQTLKILQQPKCKLTIFPEGGCSYQNDTVMQFRTGAIELAFKAVSKLAKQEADSDLYLVPVSIQYFYLGKTDRQIDRSLSELETALSISPAKNDFYLRLRAIAARVLDNLEAEYQIDSNLGEDWNFRIARLKKTLLNYCEDKLNLASATQLPNRERVYRVQSMLEDSSQLNPDLSEGDHQHLKLTTVRLLNFDAIYDGYVAEKPTSERFLATIDRLEREVFQIDRPKSKGLRKARIKIGTPINARQYLSDLHGDSQKIIQELTQTIQHQVQANLS